ncbi:hypothetical protein ABZT47_26395 [Sphaerisporangium sp. NPDC005289]|uniref:hypothetical protein n=1 Tax=Sphaerisporangium sp. NPDC005289 TaxID=3155247 RepID=UPI0033A06B99
MRSGVFRLLARALAAAVMIVPFVVAPAQAWTPRATIALRPAAWTYVSSAEAQRSHWNEDIDAPVGLAGTFDQADEPPTVYRSFYGGAYRWRVRTEDAYEQVSEWSPWCEYVVDTTRPERSGTVAGTPYSGPTPVGGPGVPGQFTMRPNGVADVGGYYYKMDDEQWSRVDAGPDGTGTLTWTPTAAGLHQLVVVSADRADNRSMFVTFYYFVVASAG